MDCTDTQPCAHTHTIYTRTTRLLTQRHNLLLYCPQLHKDEICSKLVDIMRERLAAGVKQIASEADAWGMGSPMGAAAGQAPLAGQPGPGPTETFRSLVKTLHTLNAVLSPLMLRSDIHFIFGRVASLYRWVWVLPTAAGRHKCVNNV